VIIRCEHSAFADHSLPKAPDLCKVMDIIWRLPIGNVNTNGLRANRPNLDVNRDGDGQSADPKVYSLPQP